MQLSVGSPTTRYGARKPVFANALAPHEPVSSPASSSMPKSVFPASASLLHASTMANTCPFASQLPRPVTVPSRRSSGNLGAMYGGTVSMWVQ